MIKCEKHNHWIVPHLGMCVVCHNERMESDPEYRAEREASRQRLIDHMKNIGVVIEFAVRAKKKLVHLGKFDTRVRIKCPADHPDSEVHYVHIGIYGRRHHVHMACDDEKCIYRLIE